MTGRRQADGAVVSVKKLLAKTGFELGHLPAYRDAAEPQFVRRARKPAKARGELERRQVTQEICVVGLHSRIVQVNTSVRNGPLEALPTGP